MNISAHERADPAVFTLWQAFISVAFVIGAAFNVAALCILCSSKKNRNNKHVLMLRCLAVNDLVAQIGMLVLLNWQKFNTMPTHWKCVGYVLLRAFGIGSGTVAFVMAVERWLALTRPFHYQTWVTLKAVKRSIFALWLSAMLLTYLPLLGFGLYYDKEECKRYRNAVFLVDKVYAYLFLGFGTTISMCIAMCNISVICELRQIGRTHRGLIRHSSKKNIGDKYHTAEEVSFAKLMAVICMIFVICWMPQMISILLAQFWPSSALHKSFTRVADMLMCIYFTLDPYVYVLQRYFARGRIRTQSYDVVKCRTSTPNSVDCLNTSSTVTLNGQRGLPSSNALCVHIVSL